MEKGGKKKKGYMCWQLVAALVHKMPRTNYCQWHFLKEQSFYWKSFKVIFFIWWKLCQFIKVNMNSCFNVAYFMFYCLKYMNAWFVLLSPVMQLLTHSLLCRLKWGAPMSGLDPQYLVQGNIRRTKLFFSPVLKTLAIVMYLS